MNRFALLILLTVLAIPTASATGYYLLPDNSSVPGCDDCTNVGIWLNATEGVYTGMFNITFDANCAKITSYTYNYTCFNQHQVPVIVPGRITAGYEYLDPSTTWPEYSPCTPGHAHICDFTICCNTTSPPCQTDLLFSYGTGVWSLTGRVPFTVDNGTFTCGAAVPLEETFSKPLCEGWNLISLPLDPDDNGASAVLSTVAYDAVYRYNATSKQFEGIESTDTMNSGTGYFVHATGDCTWMYNGTANTSVDVSLEQGLNMGGWLNCSKGVGDALSSISEEYYYVARWNATAEKFEVYNPVAPSAFNDDFTTMDRGTGYFISAKQDCALYESC